MLEYKVCGTKFNAIIITERPDWEDTDDEQI